MEKIVIKGGKKLVGEIEISGAKNAAVAIIPAVLLSDGICRLENLPNISDVSSMIRILKDIGADIKIINKNCRQKQQNFIRKLDITLQVVVYQ